VINANRAKRRTPASRIGKTERLANLLEVAAKKYNQSAEATCQVARRLTLMGRTEDQAFERAFEVVCRLAELSWAGKPNYARAARELIRKIAGEGPSDGRALRG
jgi:hypothetical protein